MQRSINYLCQWCELVCDDILVYYRHVNKTREDPPPDSTFRVAVRLERLKPLFHLYLNVTIENSWSPQRRVFTTPDDNAAAFITERGVLEKVDVPKAYALISQRIHECESQHPRCPPPTRATLPTRVLDCQDPSCPRLFVTADAAPDYYVALSYVWGENQPHRTTSSTFPAYTERIDTKCIPRTIRDAIKHTLGLRYLWVDAYCIIQDSKEDKVAELARMRSIFRNAYITIIAANAHKVSSGFLNPFALYNTPSTVPFRCPDGGIGTMCI